MDLRAVDVDVWRLVRVGAAAPSLLVLAAVLLYQVAKTLPHCWRLLDVSKGGGGPRGRATLNPSPNPSPDVTESVEENLLLARLERTRLLCHALTIFIGLVVATGVKVSLDGVKPALTQGADAVMWLLLNVSIPVMIRPAILTARNMEVLTCAIPALLGMLVSPLLCSEELALWSLTLGNVAAIIVCVVRRPRNPRRAPVFVLSMLFFGVCGVWNLWYFSTCGWTNERSSSRNIDVVLGQMGAILIGLCCGSLCEQSDRRLVTCSLHLEEVRQLYAAATALLRYSFDVMVEVDDRGEIISPASELSSLVLRSSTKLQGTQLVDLFTLEGWQPLTGTS